MLGTLTEDAVRRLLADPDNISSANRLFTDEEREQLGQMLAATNATAELLGRARIRKRLEQEGRYAEKFAEDATDFACFDDKPLHPLSPRRALEWFRRLIPGLRPDPERFEQQQQGFNLAVTTEETLLGRIKSIITRVLRTGEGVRAAPKMIEKILDNAGVTPKNPQYAEMCFRTNMMSAYNRGSHEEMQDPDVKDAFPVWRYVGIRDGRQGADHEPHFDRYYPNHVSFEEVRGPRAYNCRCTSIPIFHKKWRELQQRGAQVAKFAERDVSEEPRDSSGKWTAGGGAAKKTKPAKNKKGKPAANAPHPGSVHGSTVTVKPSKQRAFDGKTPVKTKTTLTKQETGRVGEAVVLAYLKSQGHEDARPMNSSATNFPVDMLEDHRPTEVKAGLVSNSRKAQQWRLTFSKESAAEKALYEKMTPAERKQWNAEKQKRIHERKQAVIKQLEKQTGQKVKPRTMTVVINPDTKTADIYEFDGLHDRIDWQSPLAHKSYKASVKYGD